MASPSHSLPPRPEEPSAEVAHVPRPEGGHADLTRLFNEAAQTVLEGVRLGEMVTSGGLTGANPLPALDRTGIDVIGVQLVRGRLVLWLVQAKYGRPDGYVAALVARQAILESRSHGDWVPRVMEFAERWLGIRRVTRDWLEAVSTALVGDWVDAVEDAVASSTVSGGPAVGRVRQESQRIHRQLQPLWRRTAGKRTVVMLDGRYVGACSWQEQLAGAGSTLSVEAAALPWAPESPAGEAVFGQLRVEEQAVARAWALRGGERGQAGWEAAAVAAGFEPAMGCRVMRKLRRLGNRYATRRAHLCERGGAA